MSSENLEATFPDMDEQLRRGLQDLEDDPAGLGRLDDALTTWSFETGEALRHGLRNLEDDHTHLDQLRDMLVDWRAETDIFDALGLHGQEEFHSNLLAWLLNPVGSHGLGGGFLLDFLYRSGAGYRAINASRLGETRVTRERHVELDGSRGRLDIRILNEAAGFLAVVENKTWSEESEGQLAYYREVLDNDYPGWRIHRVFLTPAGRPSADVGERDYWNEMSYRDILELVEGTIGDRGNAVHQDVAAFLRQYAITLRRNIVTDVSNDVHQLARRIYRKHQAAIDLIIEHREQYRPNHVTEGTRMLREAFEERRGIWRRGTCNQPYFRFMSENWARYECLKLTEWPHSPLLFQIHVTVSAMAMGLYLVSVGEEALRRKIFDCVMENPTAFNCQGTEYQDGGITLHQADDILTPSDYEHWWDEETIRETISRRLDEFAEREFPRIDQIIVGCLDDYEAEMR